MPFIFSDTPLIELIIFQALFMTSPCLLAGEDLQEDGRVLADVDNVDIIDVVDIVALYLGTCCRRVAP